MRQLLQSLRSRTVIRTAAIICVGFWLTSTAYLAWAYTVMKLVSPRAADAVSLVAAYLFQAAGIGLFELFLRTNPSRIRQATYAALLAHLLCLIPAVLAVSLRNVLLFGLPMNLLCGWISGYYLYRLTAGTAAGIRAVTLGSGYGMSILFLWLLSLSGNDHAGNSVRALWICLLLTLAMILLTARAVPVSPDMMKAEHSGPDMVKTEHSGLDMVKAEHSGQDMMKAEYSGHDMMKAELSDPAGSGLFLSKELPLRSILLSAGSLVLIFSIVNSCGFGFPSADLNAGVSLEFSRLFYAAGLIIAGIVHDTNRRYGAVCALSALVIPFIMLALKGESVSLMIFWALSYFAFGFYSVFRMILFSDISGQKNLLWLSGFGLLIGRIGDAVGEAVHLLCLNRLPLLVLITAILFIAAVVLFLRVYRILYLPENRREPSERERFNAFSAQHDLSAREREVLRLLLQEKSSSEIAQTLSVSESTVKFHIHNLLQKTGCKNRVALLSEYATRT